MILADAQLPEGQSRDIRIVGGRITAVAPSLTPKNGESVLSLEDYRVFPGAIDVHVHFREPGDEHKETWTTGSRSAAAGGVTTVVDQPNTNPPTITGEAFEQKANLAERSLVDYGLNGGVTTDWNPETLLSSPIFALGEIFLADSTGEMGIDQPLFERALTHAKAHNLPVTVHAEDASKFDPAAIEQAQERVGIAASGDNWSQYRPAAAEIAGIETAITAAESQQLPVHIAHTSTPEGIDLVADADTTCEVTPHHAFLSRADLDTLGTFGRMNPPLRSEERRSAVFDRIVNGTVDIIATDHAPHTQSEKEATIVDAPSGVPGVETMLPLLLAAALDGRLDYSRVRDLVAANPASIFDIPDKGRIAPGYDADLVVFDPDQTTRIDGDQLHSKCGWTPFEGMEGVFPLLTMVRGTVVYADQDGPFAEMSPDGSAFGPAVGHNIRCQ